jgi:hypothetical protein
MIAGETTETVLDSYGLLIHTGRYAAHVDWKKLGEFKKQISQ